MSGRGRRSAAAAAVVLFLLCDVTGYAPRRKCFDIGCCFNSRLLQQRTRLTCNFSIPTATVSLRRVLSRLEDVRITQGRKVFLQGEAVANNDKLRSLLFSGIQELTLEANNKVQMGAGRVISLTVRRVGALRLNTSSFFGWQSTLATVSIGDAESVHIDQDAFPAGSSFRSVRLFNITSLTLEKGAIRSTVGRLEMENIHSLQLTSGAINGTVETLSLRDVSAASCPPSAIGGSIDLVSLHSVTLPSLESRCLDASRDWMRLTLTDSRLGHLSPHSIHGIIGNVTISGCQIIIAGPAAVSVTVGRLSLSDSTVGELAPRALQVRAVRSVALRRLSVFHLRSDALRGLQITDTTGGGGGISVSRLSVDRAEPGSLRFSDGASVTLQGLLLPGGCVCSTPSWARQLLRGPSGGEDSPSGGEDSPSGGKDSLSGGEDSLSGGEDSPSGGKDSLSGGKDSLSGGEDSPSSSGPASERDTLLQQVEAGLCTVGGDNISLSDFSAQYCEDAGGAGGVSGQPAGRSAPLAGWWSYLGVAALTAVLLVAASLLVITAARYRRRRQKRRHEWPEPTGAGTGRPTDQQPKSLFSEVTERASNGGGQRTDVSPPAGESKRELLHAIPPEETEGSCAPAAKDGNREPLYASLQIITELQRCTTEPERKASIRLLDCTLFQPKTEECSCKPARVTAVEPVYANMPHGKRAAEPTDLASSQSAGTAGLSRY